jgi:hypothetical protein
MNKEAFVYKWVNLNNGKIYIGYHKGDINDGYVSSSHNKEFWDDFYDDKNNWERHILFFGSKNDCLKYEQGILKEIDIRNEKYYNDARGSEIIFTKNVLYKMSKSQKKRWEEMSDEVKKSRNKKISESKKGVKRPKEIGEHLSNLHKGKTFEERFGEDKAKLIGKKISDSNTGKHYHSEEHKKKLSLKLKGNDYGKNQSEETREIKRKKWMINNPGKNKSEETKRKISESKKGKSSPLKGKSSKKIICPYCGKEGGVGIMNRWHFDNCKNK